MASSDPYGASHKRQRLMQTPYTGAEAVRRILENFGSINSAMARFGETLYAIQNSASAIDNEFHALARNMKMTRGSLSSLSSKGFSSSSVGYSSKGPSLDERLAQYEQEQAMKKDIREAYAPRVASTGEKLSNFANEQFAKKSISKIIYGEKKETSDEEKLSKYKAFLEKKEELYKTSLRRNRTLAIASFAMEQEARRSVRESILVTGYGEGERSSKQKTKKPSGPPASSYTKENSSANNLDKAAYVVLDLETAAPEGVSVGSEEYAKEGEIIQVAMQYVNSAGQVLDTVQAFFDKNSNSVIATELGSDGTDKFSKFRETYEASEKKDPATVAREIQNKNQKFLTPDTKLVGKNIGPFDLKMLSSNPNLGKAGILGQALSPLTDSKVPIHDIQDMFKEIFRKESFLGGNKGVSETNEKIFNKLGSEDLSEPGNLNRSFNIEAMLSALKPELDELAKDLGQAGVNLEQLHDATEDVRAENLLYQYALRRLRVLDGQILAQKTKEKTLGAKPSPEKTKGKNDKSKESLVPGAATLSGLPDVLKVEIVKSIPLFAGLNPGIDSASAGETLNSTLNRIVQEGIKISEEPSVPFKETEEKEAELKANAIKTLITQVEKNTDATRENTEGASSLEIEKPSPSEKPKPSTEIQSPILSAIKDVIMKTSGASKGGGLDKVSSRILTLIPKVLSGAKEKISEIGSVQQSLKDPKKQERLQAFREETNRQIVEDTTSEKYAKNPSKKIPELEREATLQKERDIWRNSADPSIRGADPIAGLEDIIDNGRRFTIDPIDGSKRIDSKDEHAVEALEKVVSILEKAYLDSAKSKEMVSQAETLRNSGNPEALEQAVALEKEAEELFKTASQTIIKITRMWDNGELENQVKKFSDKQKEKAKKKKEAQEREAEVESVRETLNAQPNPWNNITKPIPENYDPKDHLETIETVPHRLQEEQMGPPAPQKPYLEKEYESGETFNTIPDLPFKNESPDKDYDKVFHPKDARFENKTYDLDEEYVPSIDKSGLDSAYDPSFYPETFAVSDAYAAAKAVNPVVEEGLNPPAQSLDNDSLAEKLSKAGLKIVSQETAEGEQSAFTVESGRPIVEVEDEQQRRMKFYKSQEGTSGKEAGRWYPTGGVVEEQREDDGIKKGWIVKGDPKNDPGMGRPSLLDMENKVNSIFPTSDNMEEQIKFLGQLGNIDVSENKWFDLSKKINKDVYKPKPVSTIKGPVDENQWEDFKTQAQTSWIQNEISPTFGKRETPPNSSPASYPSSPLTSDSPKMDAKSPSSGGDNTKDILDFVRALPEKNTEESPEDLIKNITFDENVDTTPKPKTNLSPVDLGSLITPLVNQSFGKPVSGGSEEDEEYLRNMFGEEFEKALLESNPKLDDPNVYRRAPKTFNPKQRPKKPPKYIPPKKPASYPSASLGILSKDTVPEATKEMVSGTSKDLNIPKKGFLANLFGFAEGGVFGKNNVKAKDPRDKNIVAVRDGEGFVTPEAVKNNEHIVDALNTEGKKGPLKVEIPGYASGGVEGKKRNTKRALKKERTESPESPDTPSGGKSSSGSANPLASLGKVFNDFISTSRIAVLGKAFSGLTQSSSNLLNNFAGLIKGSDPFNTLTGSFELLSGAVGMQFIPIIMRVSSVIQEMSREIQNGTGFFGGMVQKVSDFINNMSSGSLKMLISFGAIAGGLMVLSPLFTMIGSALTGLATIFSLGSTVVQGLIRGFMFMLPVLKVAGGFIGVLGIKILAIVALFSLLYLGIKKLTDWLGSKAEKDSKEDKNSRETLKEKSYAEGVANRGGSDPKKREEALAAEKAKKIKEIQYFEAQAAIADKAGNKEKGSTIRNEYIQESRRQLNALENQTLVERDPKQIKTRNQTVEQRQTGKPGTPSSGGKGEPNNLAVSLRANKAQPAYSSIEEAYKKIQVSALGTDPLEAEKQRQQEQMTQRMLEGMKGTTEAVNKVNDTIASQRSK